MNLADFQGTVFESSSGRTPQFAAFSSAYRRHLVNSLKGSDFKLVTWSVGHFYCSAFIENQHNFKLAYINFSDVRFFPGDWLNHVLVRSAQHMKDYTGGRNTYTPLCHLVAQLWEVTA